MEEAVAPIGGLFDGEKGKKTRLFGWMGAGGMKIFGIVN